jgi:3-hydroxyisobutyrate dehydrogenase-like beta-hydroxyacid dehydrogenase
MAEIGFVGTGTMGTPIAGHLLDAGHTLRVHDAHRAATERLRSRGATVAASPAEAADGAEVVLLSLPGPDEVVEVVTGANGVLASARLPAIVVDVSTNSVDAVRRLRARCAESGVAFVDAPVSGGLGRAITGTLAVLVGATDDELAAVGPLLGSFGEPVVHVGPPGAGTVAKLVNNQLFLGAGLLVQEAFLMGAASGLDPADLLDVLKVASAGPYAKLAPLLVGRAFDDVAFRLDVAAKDLAVAADSARALGLDLPVTEAAATVFAGAVAAGLGSQAFHATLVHLESGTGVVVPPLYGPERQR